MSMMQSEVLGASTITQCDAYPLLQIHASQPELWPRHRHKKRCCLPELVRCIIGAVWEITDGVTRTARGKEQPLFPLARREVPWTKEKSAGRRVLSAAPPSNLEVITWAAAFNFRVCLHT